MDPIWHNLPNDLVYRIFEALPIDLRIKLKVKPRRLNLKEFEDKIGRVISKPLLFESTIHRKTFRRIVNKNEISSYIFDVEISDSVDYVVYNNINSIMTILAWMENENWYFSGWIYGVNLFAGNTIHF